MKILRAKTAGFCMGVSLALHRLEQAMASMPELTRRGQRLLTLGPVIHNPRVIKEYEARGVLCIDDPGQARRGDHVLIRAHGIPRHVEEELIRREAVILDATCPRVKAAQLAIEKQRKEGLGTLLLFGEADHPEVRGLVSYADGDALVFGDIDALEALALNEKGAYYLASQTTQDIEAFAQVKDMLHQKLKSPVPILETICGATRKRQLEAYRLAGKVDIMVVVGGLNSGNTRRLADIARSQGVPVVQVESAAELPRAMFQGKERVGLTAGASTPADHIRGVHEALAGMG